MSYDPNERRVGGKWSKGGTSTAFKLPTSDPIRSHSFKAASLDAQRYGDLQSYTDTVFNTPGGRLFPQAAREANELLESKGQRAQDYEVKLVPTHSVKPSQSKEDYLNDSSRHTASSLQQLTAQEEPDFEAVRRQDHNPIVLMNNRIIDGNHRHAAAALNGDTHILAMTPVGAGSGKIRNIADVYGALKSGNHRLLMA